MASFNDYLKEIDNLKEQLKTDRDTLKLRIEQLSMFKGFYGNNYGFMENAIIIAYSKLSALVDMLDGFLPLDEKDIPDDEKFLSEMELKAKAFDDILHAWRKNQWPEEFSQEVTNIIDELLGNVEIEPDPELDKEPEEYPQPEDLEVNPETINSIMQKESKAENSIWVGANTKKDSNGRFKAFYESLHKGAK